MDKPKQTPGYLAGIIGVAASWCVAAALFQQPVVPNLLLSYAVIGITGACVTSAIAPRNRSAQWTLLAIGALAMLRIAFVIEAGGPFNVVIVLMAAAATLVAMQFVPWRVIPAIVAVAAPGYLLVDAFLAQRERQAKEALQFKRIEEEYPEAFRTKHLARLLLDANVQWIGSPKRVSGEVYFTGTMSRGSVEIYATPYSARFAIKVNVSPPFNPGHPNDESRRERLLSWLTDQGLRSQNIKLGDVHSNTDWQFSSPFLYSAYIRDKRDHIVIEGMDTEPDYTVGIR